MKKIIIVSEPLAKALFKAAHRKEMSQQKFMELCLVEGIQKVAEQDNDIGLLLTQHDAVVSDDSEEVAL